jgi:hypothetical protein
MQFLSHRGYWHAPQEKNTELAFARSFGLGFGTETDVRDLDGQLVISHDPPRAGALPLGRFLDLYMRHGHDVPLALNVKSDGIESLLGDELGRRGITNYFVFDMSVPDTLRYLRRGMSFYTRQSEHEPTPALYQACSGVWMDAFAGEWYGADDIAGHLAAGKSVCLVSPELHGRDPVGLWRQIGAWLGSGAIGAGGDHDRIMLCTDHPERARAVVAVVAAAGHESLGGQVARLMGEHT